MQRIQFNFEMFFESRNENPIVENKKLKRHKL